MSKNYKKVPFSWENEPGVSKVVIKKEYYLNDEGRRLSSKLPPPPCRMETGRSSVHDIQIPLPPCAFQPPLRSFSRKGLKGNKYDEDPFLAAFKQCTKTTRKRNLNKKGIFHFSCKNSCSVREDNLVRVSHQSLNKKNEEM